MRRKEKQTIMRKTGSKNKRSDSCSAETSKLLKNWARKQLKQPHCTQKNESAMYKINIYIYTRDKNDVVKQARSYSKGAKGPCSII